MSLQSAARDLVWNREEGRPHTPVRIVAGVAIIGVLMVIATALPAVVFGIFEAIMITTTALATLVAVAASAVGTVLGVWLAGRYVDRRRFVDFGLRIDREWWLDCGFGLALGGALMTGIFLVELAAGWITVTAVLAGETLLAGAITAVVLFVFVGIYEELLLRGYLLTNLAEGSRGILGTRWAIAVAVVASSLVFGAVHASNPNATLVSVLTISVAGVMLALGYVLTGELAIPMGLHTTWNLFQGTVYGFPVSGLDISASIVTVEQSGPGIVTGGAFGPEAGLIGLAAMLAGCLAILGWIGYRYGGLALNEDVAIPGLR